MLNMIKMAFSDPLLQKQPTAAAAQYWRLSSSHLLRWRRGGGREAPSKQRAKEGNEKKKLKVRSRFPSYICVEGMMTMLRQLDSSERAHTHHHPSLLCAFTFFEPWMERPRSLRASLSSAGFMPLTTRGSSFSLPPPPPPPPPRA